MQNILVTGGLGFIGSHLAEELISRGYTVTILDNKKNPEVKPNCKIITGDITDKKTVERAAKGKDTIFHFAAQVSVVVSVKNPILTAETNVLGTINVLEAAIKNDTQKIVNISSSSVYGEPVKLPIDESHILNPKSPYAASKLAAENFCRAYYHLYGIPMTIIRYFNVYGPRQQGEYAGVVQIFARRVMEGKPPIIFGDGIQTRDFVYVKDAVTATISSADTKGYEVFNIGSGTRKTVNEIAKMVLNHFKSDLKPVYQDPRPGDPKHTLADISKAKKLLGYSPRYTFEQGLTETLDWFSKK